MVRVPAWGRFTEEGSKAMCDEGEFVSDGETELDVLWVFDCRHESRGGAAFDVKFAYDMTVADL